MSEEKSSVILVVDDDDLVRMTLSVLVGSLVYHYLVAGDGVEAVSVLESTSVDLVLSDIVMPGMDGLAQLSRIKEDHKDTDVIISTGFHEKASYAEVIKAGAIDFFQNLSIRRNLRQSLHVHCASEK